MLLSCLIALLYALPALVLLALMRTQSFPLPLKNSLIVRAVVETLLWVVGVQVLTESILLTHAYELLREEATRTWQISGLGVLLRVVLTLPIFLLPHLVSKRPLLGILSSSMWALLMGQPLLIQMTFSVPIIPALTRIGIEPVFVTPLTLTCFIIGALWCLSVQNIARPIEGFSMIRPLFQRLQIPFNKLIGQWCSVFGLYAWLALGLIFISAGTLSVNEVRIRHYGLILFYSLASILMSLWVLWSSKYHLRRLIREKELNSTQQISLLESNIFMRQQQIVRMLSGANAGAIFWQAAHAHVQTGSQNWRRGLVEYHMDAIELPVALRPSDNLEVFFRKCLTVAEFERLAVALDSVFLGTENQFVMELEGALTPKGQHTYKLYASALRSQAGPGILFFDVLLLNYCEEKNLRQQWQTAAQIRKETLFSVGHDLGSPLGLVRISTNLLRRHLENSGTLDAYAVKQLTRIDASVLEAHAYLKNALDFAQSDQPDFRFPEMDIVPEPWLQSLLDKQRVIYSLSADRIKLDVPEGTTLLKIQEQAFQMIATNLISNAFKYGASTGGLITVRLCQGRDGRNQACTVFEVADEGAGIPVSVRKALYQPFKRGLNTGNIGGTGLGLTIVRRGVECLGGSIDILPVKRGTHFRVCIPVQLVCEQTEIPA